MGHLPDGIPWCCGSGKTCGLACPSGFKNVKDPEEKRLATEHVKAIKKLAKGEEERNIELYGQPNYAAYMAAWNQERELLKTQL